MSNILNAAKNLLKTIKESDIKCGCGDRVAEENQAIKDLKLAISREEEIFNVTYGNF